MGLRTCSRGGAGPEQQGQRCQDCAGAQPRAAPCHYGRWGGRSCGGCPPSAGLSTAALSCRASCAIDRRLCAGGGRPLTVCKQRQWQQGRRRPAQQLSTSQVSLGPAPPPIRRVGAAVVGRAHQGRGLRSLPHNHLARRARPSRRLAPRMESDGLPRALTNPSLSDDGAPRCQGLATAPPQLPGRPAAPLQPLFQRQHRWRGGTGLPPGPASRALHRRRQGARPPGPGGCERPVLPTRCMANIHCRGPAGGHAGDARL